MGKLAFLGDVYLKNKENYISIPEPYVFNYECVASGEHAKPMINKINLKGVQNFDGFSSLPIAVNLANNHILDYLDEGVADTISVLENNQINYFGVGTKENNYNNPCILQVGGRKIAFLGYSDVFHSLEQKKTMYQVARADAQQIKKDISLCKRQGAERIIVNIHWGREERFWNTKHQQELGRLFINLGASLVIGHHPHCIQPVECYKGRYIFYSLGNAYFPDIASPAYYNEEGKSEFIMHKKHFRYGKKSLKVVYDVESDEVISIQLLKLEGDRLTNKGEIAWDAVVAKRYRYRFVNDFTGYCHMLALFVRGYLFADGKLFSLKAVKKELEFLKNRK